MTRSPFIVALATLGVMSLGPASPSLAQLADTPWPAFGHDLRHTGRSDTYSGPSTSKVGVKWAYKAVTSIKTSPTVGPDGTVYFGVGIAPVCAVNPLDGSLKWCTTGGGDATVSSPAVAVDPTATGPGGGPVLYMGARDNKLWAVKDNGQASYAIQWRGKIKLDGDLTTSPAVDPATKTVYAACGCLSSCGCLTTGHLRAWDPDPADITDGPGEVVWDSAMVPGVHASSPALDDRPFAPLHTTTPNPHYRRIYIGSSDGVLRAFLPDGTAKWTIATGPMIHHASPAIGDDGVIYIGSSSGLTAVSDDGDSAHVIWPFVTDGSVESSPALGADGTIYVATSKQSKGTFHAIKANGQEKWRVTNLSGPVFSSPAIGANGLIYVAAGKVVSAYRDDGTHASLLWKVTFKGVVKWSSPAIGFGGVLYVGSWDHNLYAIEDKP